MGISVGKGRPSIYSEELADTICSRLAGGETILRMCKNDENLPCEKTVYSWLMQPDKQYFLQSYHQAREIQAERMAEELIDIADDGINDWMMREDPNNPGYTVNGEHIQRSKLRVDTRKWVSARLLPKKYGDRIQTENKTELSGGLNIISFADIKNDSE